MVARCTGVGIAERLFLSARLGRSFSNPMLRSRKSVAGGEYHPPHECTFASKGDATATRITRRCQRNLIQNITIALA